MGQDKEIPWPLAWSAQLGTRIRALRDAAGLSAQKLSDRCEEFGFPIPRSTIANIESGRKEAIPVHEVAVLAAALGTSPASLLFPLDEPVTVPVLPGVSLHPFEGWTWFSGNAWMYNSHLPPSLGPGRASMGNDEIMAVQIRLAELINAWTTMRRTVNRMDQIALSGSQSDASKSIRDSLEKLEGEMTSALEYLRAHNVQPPQVAEELAANLAAIIDPPRTTGASDA
jgi:transcriptional regulator with XRE-family HTH domain